MDEGHADNAAEVLGRLLKAREDAPVLLEPADQTFHDIAIAISLFVERHRPSVAVLVLFGRDHRLDVQFQQVLVDPVGAIAFVAGQRRRPGDRLAVGIVQLLVGVGQQGVECGAFVRLARRDVKVQRVALTITKNVDFGA